jgi:hypothetical protein
MKIPDPNDEPVISVVRAGEILGLGRAAAYTAVRRGDIPHFKIGRRYVVPTAGLRQLLGLDR